MPRPCERCRELERQRDDAIVAIHQERRRGKFEAAQLRDRIRKLESKVGNQRDALANLQGGLGRA